MLFFPSTLRSSNQGIFNIKRIEMETTEVLLNSYDTNGRSGLIYHKISRNSCAVIFVIHPGNNETRKLNHAPMEHFLSTIIINEIICELHKGRCRRNKHEDTLPCASRNDQPFNFRSCEAQLESCRVNECRNSVTISAMVPISRPLKRLQNRRSDAWV